MVTTADAPLTPLELAEHRAAGTREADEHTATSRLPPTPSGPSTAPSRSSIPTRATTSCSPARRPVTLPRRTPVTLATSASLGGADGQLFAAGAAVVNLRTRPRPLAVLAWTLWAVAMAILALIPVSDQLLRNAGRPDLVQFTTDTIPPFLSALSAATVGAVLAHRRPRHPVGWLLLALTTCLVATGVTAQYVVYDQLIGPDALPAIHYVVRFYPATVIAAFVLLSFVLLLTPTGALPSPRWRWWANATVAASVVCLAAVMLLPGTADTQSLVNTSPVDGRSFDGALRLAIEVGVAVGVATTVVAAGSLAARFRRASGVERQQLRWVAIAAALTVLTAPAAVATSAPGDVVSWAGGLSFAVVPMALGAAVLRYRLYDLDHIISRTLTYGLLTLLLGRLLHRNRADARATGGSHVQPGRGRRHLGGRRHVRTRATPHPNSGGSTLQPTQIRRGAHAGGVPRPPTARDRHRHGVRGPARSDHRDHATHGLVALAAAAGCKVTAGTREHHIATPSDGLGPRSRRAAGQPTAVTLSDRQR